ncbi:hypothetical protein BCU90_20570 [Vibrio lentus]|uniref:Glycosyltransferase family 2 protein n=1 Tax=Vibrio splendidus TaxID=29497 RepID=A0A7Y4FY99_VIBSP|nr:MULTISPECIES: glycosyltransferase family 2 protein [Vibrio]NOJ11315.1 glycosyltransferase family 2 protein [Vibrio splendidus]PMG44919.1 hypothetical protein BCU90_20570 [Vibrio lentus]
MLISVIIPSYNYERTLPNCIKAIQNQTYRNIEIIVVDDHSTDDSLTIANSFDVTTLQTPKNSGVAAARNTGVRHAKGSVFMFVDADVVLESNAIENAISILNDDPTAISVCGLYEPIPLIEDSIWETFRSYQAYVWRIASVGYVSGGFFSLGLITRKAFYDVGFFNEELRQTEEIDYGERLTRKGNIILTDQVIGKHDDDYKLLGMCKKFFRRSKDRVPFYLKKKEAMQGFELPKRLINTMAITIFNFILVLLLGNSGLDLFSLAIQNTLSNTLLLTPIVVLLERDMFIGGFRFFQPHKYILFAMWYWLFHTVAGIGVIAGIAQYLISSKFRNLYQWEDLNAN